MSRYISRTTALLTSFVAVVLICTKPLVASAQVEQQSAGGPWRSASPVATVAKLIVAISRHVSVVTRTSPSEAQ